MICVSKNILLIVNFTSFCLSDRGRNLIICVRVSLTSHCSACAFPVTVSCFLASSVFLHRKKTGGKFDVLSGLSGNYHPFYATASYYREVSFVWLTISFNLSLLPGNGHKLEVHNFWNDLTFSLNVSDQKYVPS